MRHEEHGLARRGGFSIARYWSDPALLFAVVFLT
jgi:hypothetical protein